MSKRGLCCSDRCQFIIKSEIRTMSLECEEVGGINLSQGVCDMPAPKIVRDGAKRAIDAGNNSYTRHDGIAQLREAVAAKLKSFNKLKYDPETEIVISSGSTGSFYSACLALLNPGDEVIIFEPYYAYHVQTVQAAQGVPVYVRLKLPGWTFTAKDLEAAASPRTKAIVVNTPGNPSGKIFTKEELETIAAFAKKHDIFIFSDEIYEHFTYDGKKHISPAAVAGAKDRTITISGVSKTFSITGWRIGYSASPAKWAQMIGYMTDLVYVCPPAPLQHGVAQGIRGLGKDYYTEILSDLTKKREQICNALDTAGMTPYVPQGAYYVLADISRLKGRTSKQKAMWLLEKTGVACVPGEAFFHKPDDGQNIARFCYAKTDTDLQAACKCLALVKIV